MSYRFSRDIGYQRFDITNPWVFANYGQPQRGRGYVSPMVYQTQEPFLREPNLGGLGIAPMLMARMAATPAKYAASRTATHMMATRMAAAPTMHAASRFASRMAATPEMSAARMAVARMSGAAMPLAVRTTMAAARMAASPQSAALHMAAAHRMAARTADSPRLRAAHMAAAKMAANAALDPDMAAMHVAALCGLGQATTSDPTTPIETSNVTAQSVLDEELARSRRMEIVSVASLVLGVASYMLFRSAMKKNPGGGRRRRHRRHS